MQQSEKKAIHDCDLVHRQKVKLVGTQRALAINPKSKSFMR